jgi:hypothetical protein
MQTIRKRELKRAMNILHERIKLHERQNSLHLHIPGLRESMTILGEMRKAINSEVSRG